MSDLRERKREDERTDEQMIEMRQRLRVVDGYQNHRERGKGNGGFRKIRGLYGGETGRRGQKKNKLLDWNKQKTTYKRPSEFSKTENR